MSRKKKGQGPNLNRPLTTNPATAESGDFNIYFTWHGLDLVVDVKNLELGRMEYAIRRFGRKDQTPQTQVKVALDFLEGLMGSEQLDMIADAEPHFFDRTEVYTSFWDAFNTAVSGADSGNSLAS